MKGLNLCKGVYLVKSLSFFFTERSEVSHSQILLSEPFFIFILKIPPQACVVREGSELGNEFVELHKVVGLFAESNSNSTFVTQRIPVLRFQSFYGIL